jgi:hypothetical protein
MSPWVTQSGGVGAAQAAIDRENTAVEDMALRVRVSQAGTNNRNARIQQTGVPLTQGRRYRLQFRARAAAARSVTPVVCSNSSGAALVGDTSAIELSTQWAEFERTFDMVSASVTSGQVEFRCGLATGDWFIDDVLLEDIGSHSTSARGGTAVRAPFKAAFNGGAITLTGAIGRRADVTVFDMAGRVRLSKTVSMGGAGERVSLDRLPAGVYSVRYRVDGKAAGQNERIMLAK